MDVNKYDRQVELVDITDAQELAVKMIMQEGALRFQEQAISALKANNLDEAVTVVEAVNFEL